MQKLFAVLVADLAALGASVVAGSFNSIIIATGKRNMGAAGEACGEGMGCCSRLERRHEPCGVLRPLALPQRLGCAPTGAKANL